MNKPQDQYSKDGNELIRGNVRVEWVDLGEGLSEDYRPDDPEDVHILRFDVSVKLPAVKSVEPMTAEDVWIDPGDASYCTRFPASASIDQRKDGLKLIMDRVYDDASRFPEGRSIKKLCEELSWIRVEDVRKQDFFVQGLIFLTATIIYSFLALVAFMVASSERSLFALFLFIVLAIIAYLYVPLARFSWRLNSDMMKLQKTFPQP